MQSQDSDFLFPVFCFRKNERKQEYRVFIASKLSIESGIRKSGFMKMLKSLWCVQRLTGLQSFFRRDGSVIQEGYEKEDEGSDDGHPYASGDFGKVHICIFVGIS